jgi:CubicO group peptidase (beta-lactamase class C family)
VIRTICTVAAMIVTAACGTGGALRDARLEPLRAKLQDAVAKGEIASVSVAVAVDGRIVWEEAFGFADRERGIRATPDTQYAIASISKPVTATGVLLLGIDIDKPVTDYLGPRGIRIHADDPPDVTVRSILQHRAGIAEHNQYYYGPDASKRPPIDETIRRYAIVAWPANETYRYSNIGYGVLEALIARVSGRPYEVFLRDAVFARYGMTRSSVGPGANSAVLHDGVGKPIPPYDFASRAAGWLFSTPRDLVRFALVHDAARKRMLAERHSTGSATGRYGFDWYCGLGLCGRDETAFGHAWYGHDGGMPGASARMKILPAQNIVAVALSNSRQELTYSIVDDILDALIADYAARRKNDPSATPAPPAPLQFPSELRGTWSGTVAGETRSVPISVTIEERGARMKIGDNAECPLDDARFGNRTVEGGCRATLPIDNPAEEPYDAWLEVELHGDRLIGIVSAYTPAPKYHFLIPTWVELRRQ